jgi:hypothetical protein
MSGTLADGTSFSQSASLSPAGAWPVYVPLYSGQGSLVSWLTFVTRPDDDLNGIVNWIKPADSRSRFYAPGFTEQILAVGSAYHRPPGTSSVIDLASGTVAFSGGNLAGPFTNKITIGKSSRVTNQSPNRLNLSFAPATGRFAGNVTAPGGGKPMPFKGVAFQRLNSGFGFMLGTNQTSRVIVGP